MPKDALNRSSKSARKIVKKLRPASAHQLSRILVDAEGAHQRLLDCLCEVARRGEVCRAFDKAPHLPVAGTTMVPLFNEMVQVGLLFLDAGVALRAMDLNSKDSVLVRVRSKNPLEAWVAFLGSRISVSGRPRSIEMDAGGE